MVVVLLMDSTTTSHTMLVWQPTSKIAALMSKLLCMWSAGTGLILQFRFFLHNDAGLLVLLFWLFSIAMSSFSYFLSVFMSKQTTATYTGFAVFLVSNAAGVWAVSVTVTMLRRLLLHWQGSLNDIGTAITIAGVIT